MLSDEGNLLVGKGTNLVNMQPLNKRVVNGLSGETLTFKGAMLGRPDTAFTFVENGGDIVVFPLLQAEAGPEQLKNHGWSFKGLQWHHIVPNNAKVEGLGVHSGFRLIRLSSGQTMPTSGAHTMVIKKTGQDTYSIRIFDKPQHGYTDYNKVPAAAAKEIDRFSTGNTKYKSDLVHMRKLSNQLGHNHHEALRLVGFNRESTRNYIPLPEHNDYHPERSTHQGSHDLGYERAINDKLDVIYEDYESGVLTKEQVKEKVFKLVSETRQGLRKGVIALNKHYREHSWRIRTGQSTQA